MSQTFDEWKAVPPPPEQRLGQHLFNTAPESIRVFVTGRLDLDPFFVDSKDRMYILNNFLLFCELAWDVHTEQDRNDILDLVMSEPNARRQ